MVKYMTCGKKCRIKELKSLVGIKGTLFIKEAMSYGTERERQCTGERQRELLQIVQMADSPIKKR